ncbi:MAG: short chain dehydrogenase [Sphingomonadales bacterium]|nr:short chain dehydrogenase [Sphingomonadales bacterium]
MAYSDRTWLVTGTSSGFGKAIAREVLDRGGRVIATARDPGSVADLVAEYGDRVLPLALDVTDKAQIAAAIVRSDAFGGVDVLVNNAGYGFLGGVEESSEDEIADQMDVNFYGALKMIRAVLPGLRDRARGGYIVNLSSIAGVCSFPGAGFYSASKFALEGLSEALAAELKGFDIGVMIVEPGYFRTDFSGRSIRVARHGHPAYRELAESRAGLGAIDGSQPGDPARGARAILDTIDAPRAPLRLALGPDAVEICEHALGRRRADLDGWAEVSRGTDFV